ncbi:hypothetical protein M3Y99_00532500 [Aphelenchoides fujianensis]|nr:hypothetical protein M3Y99_00532500 [Aphelenchoides fujianensis]
MDEYKSALDNVEEWLRRIGGMSKFQKTGSPDIFCSTLPSHWRSNKSLPCPFAVLVLHPVPDGTKVSIAAGNEENPCADIKNNVTEITAQMARFSDLRFVGKSGRGKNFNLTITIHRQPMKEVTLVNGIIKVTVDGPRDSRNPNKTLMGDPRKRPPGPLDAMSLGFSPLFAAAAAAHAAAAAKPPRFAAPPPSPHLPAAMLPQLLAAAAAGRFPPMNPPTAAFPPNPTALYESFLAAAAMNAAGNASDAGGLVGFPNAAELLQAQQASAYVDALNGLKKQTAGLSAATSFRGLRFDAQTTDRPLRPPPSKLSAALLSPPAASTASGGTATPKLPASVDLPSPRFDRQTAGEPTNKRRHSAADSTTKLPAKTPKTDSRSTVVVTPSDSNRSDEIHVDVESTDDEQPAPPAAHRRRAQRSAKEEENEPPAKKFRSNVRAEAEEPPEGRPASSSEPVAAEDEGAMRPPVIKLWRPYTPPSTTTSPEGTKAAPAAMST